MNIIKDWHKHKRWTILDSRTVDNYNAHAVERCIRYENVDFKWLYDVVGNFIKPGGTIFEIGCGSGRDARNLTGLGYKVTATDASCGMLEQAKKLDIEHKVTFLQKSFPLDINDRLFNNHYDAVLAMAVLMHIPIGERHEFLSQIARLLYPNGVAIISWSNNRNDENRLFESLEQKDVPMVFSEANFDIIKTMNNNDALGRDIAWHTVIARKLYSHCSNKE